jgi:hypothetical protein
MPAMTDRNRVQSIVQALWTSTSPVTLTAGTGGGSGVTATPPYHLRLLSAAGSDTANGTELPTASGYTAGGLSLGATFCAAPVAGVASNSNVVTWTATGTWPAVPAIEVWDNATTPLRWLQAPITPITGVVIGDTVQFAAASIVPDHSQW